jgi:predicted nucleic acid-binding protein
VIVVDTNVLAALHLEAKSSKDARSLLNRDPDWVAPGLWRYEFRNLLATLIRHGLVSLDGALLILSTVESQMGPHDHIVPSAEVLSYAASSGCTAYDCEFVVLATILAVPLVTLDRQVLRAFPRIATTPEFYLRR